MSQQSEKSLVQQDAQATPPTSSQVKKARMLVSMLGADFAKSSPHPFFRELAQTAIRPIDVKAPPPDMSKTLAKLVRRLADAEKGRVRSTPAKRTAPKLEKAKAVSPDATPQPMQDVSIMAQHPALIAKHLVKLPTAQQLDALRKLRGQTARQVAIYLGELKT
ncbi:hypothetical protein [uncultured Litoreibacter sp.]|uniref:hypothetical protein n=1 Tax=uncultured Litoreibacter sp. TaxID=1392394 RepID=UPI0026160564|nr:hypothetical protein [uncultured Litoreibacter sp.]